MKNLRIILGTGNMGGSLNEEQAHALISNAVTQGYLELDTAIVYENGESEKIIGSLKLSEQLKIATKANPEKSFSADGIKAQLNESLASLNRSSVDIFYLHWPDHKIPFEETLRGVNELYNAGKFTEFGLSNYASWEVAHIYHICKEMGYVLPTVYQGMYNALTRDVECELLPACRRFGMRFNLYNPLAGGLLSGEYDFSVPDDVQPKGRFFAQGKWMKTYQDRYWRDSYKAGVEHIKSVVNEVYGSDMTLLQASMSWICNHSQLTDNDGIILGFSKPEHFQVNVDACKTPALNEKVVQAFDEVWDKIKSDCPKYFR